MKLTDDNRIWHVTTEGDCEGRTIKDFGYFRGNVVEIAKRLSGHQYYALSFNEFKLSKYPEKMSFSNTVHFSVGMNGSGQLINRLKNEGYEVQDSQYYKSVVYNVPVDEVKKMKREMALAKLSDEEKALLGL